VHSVIETDDFVKDADDAGLSEAEVFDIVVRLSENPKLGDLISGTGGARKWRIPARGKGKRGGARVVSYFAADDVPVFLLSQAMLVDDKIYLKATEHADPNTSDSLNHTPTATGSDHRRHRHRQDRECAAGPGRGLLGAGVPVFAADIKGDLSGIASGPNTCSNMAAAKTGRSRSAPASRNRL
jgi:hypothetical protein